MLSKMRQLDMEAGVGPEKKIEAKEGVAYVPHSKVATSCRLQACKYESKRRQ